jgi:hypothetical protein
LIQQLEEQKEEHKQIIEEQKEVLEKMKQHLVAEEEVAVVLLFDEFADFVVEVVVVALLRVVALGLGEPVDFVVPELFEGLGMLFVLDRLSDFAPLKEHFLGECPLLILDFELVLQLEHY